MTITEQMVEAGARGARRWSYGERWFRLFDATIPPKTDQLEYARACLTAALATEVVGEPVAWRYRYENEGGKYTTWTLTKEQPKPFDDVQIEPLYAAPPKPVAVPTREELARLINASAFDGTFSGYLGDMTSDERHAARSKEQEARNDSLVIADSILALLTNPQVKA